MVCFFCIDELTLSDSQESVNQCPSSSHSSLMIDMSSIAVEQTNIEDTRKYPILHARLKLILLVVSMLCVGLTFYIGLTGFTNRRPAPDDSPSKPIRMSDSFLNGLRIRLGETPLNLNLANEYCRQNTSLANCEIDWHKLKAKMFPQILYFNLNSKSDCFMSNEQFTCFGPFNGTHTEVRLNKLLRWPFKMKRSSEVVIFARYILAVNSATFILVTGKDKPEQFCWFSLFEHDRHCQPF